MKLFLSIIVLSFSAAAYAQDANQIIDQCYKVFKYNGDDGRAQAEMTIHNSDGKVIMSRSLAIMRKNDEGLNQKWYAFFSAPADIRKMVFLSWKNTGTEDDRWLYLPALDLVKRLASSDKRSSFVGSQFVYEDITGRFPGLDTHTLSQEDDTYFYIESRPKKDDVEFSKYISKIRKDNHVLEERTFHDSKGNPSRQYKAEKVELIQSYPTATSFSMTDLSSGEYTLVKFSEIKYNLGLPDELFTESYLKKSPRRWLR